MEQKGRSFYCIIFLSWLYFCLVLSWCLILPCFCWVLTHHRLRWLRHQQTRSIWTPNELSQNQWQLYRVYLVIVFYTIFPCNVAIRCGGKKHCIGTVLSCLYTACFTMLLFLDILSAVPVHLRESNPRFPYKSTVNIILMNSSVHMLKCSPKTARNVLIYLPTESSGFL